MTAIAELLETISVVLSAFVISALATSFLYVLLVVVFIVAVVWLVNNYVAPIPQPILVFLAAVLIILAALYLLGGL